MSSRKQQITYFCKLSDMMKYVSIVKIEDTDSKIVTHHYCENATECSIKYDYSKCDNDCLKKVLENKE